MPINNPGIGDMKKATYDSNADGKIALANLNQAAYDPSLEVLIVHNTPAESSMHAVSYGVMGQRGFVAFKGGDFKSNRDVGDGTAFLAYRINGGSWVEIGNTDSLSYVWLTMASAITLSDGDFVELGLKNDSTSYYSYITEYKVFTLKINRIT